MAVGLCVGWFQGTVVKDWKAFGPDLFSEFHKVMRMIALDADNLDSLE